MAEQFAGRVKRVHRGLLSFAIVTVTVEPADRPSLTDGIIDNDVTGDVGPDTGMTGVRPPAELVDAARIGAARTLEALRRNRWLEAPVRVTILRVDWLFYDTRPDAVECATGIAICRALRTDEPKIIFVNDRCTLSLWESPSA